MKITIYTVTDCQFSKQEREYLTSNKLVYEEKNLETNKEFLAEMLTVSNNFAGTPVTKIEKDDGTIAVLKGFTKEEFDKTLGLAPAVVQPATPVAPVVQPTMPVEPQPAPQVAPTPPPVVPTPEPTTPTPQPTEALNSVMNELQSKVTEPTPVEQKLNDPMNSILNNLQNKASEEPTPPAPPVPVASPSVASTSGMPSIPNPDFGNS